ncbi:glycosyltransferase [Ramlibacter sp.]|uniref:glycosyltransferase n=1 Tax=Ramlibacter sp. TaxID=1917967 RepID=UPI00183A4EA1|nr:glycosyltransferase [Ramlibacter sp.]MBA2673571.1 glycosyltransferase [Ramlibacter sp.]
MRVLHVIPSLSPVHGGATRAVLLMEQALQAQGVEVETAATDDDGPGRRNGKACGQPLCEDGIVRWYFPKRAEFYKPAPAFARWIAGAAREYDLLHLHALFSFTTAAAARAARRAGVPYVVEPIGTLNRYGLGRRRPWLKRLSLALVEGPVLRHAAALRFTSEQEAEEARALGIAWREAVIPLGLEVAAFNGPERPPVPVVASQLLFLSRLDPKKNLEGLLDALSVLVPAHPQLRLTVAGDGDAAYVAQLKARAAGLGLDWHVTWAGHIEGARKAEALRTADVFVLPSFSENFGIAAAEALAAGLPCLLGEGVAIAKDVAQAGAGLAVAPDSASVTAGLRRMIDAQEDLAAMSVRARRLAQSRFSAQAMGLRLKQLYSDILTP